MASTPSHVLKLRRAEKHLQDLKSVLGPKVGKRETYSVTEDFETDEDGSRWCYRLDTGYAIDESAAILAGDFMFNVRSALDHLLCSLIPAEAKRNAQFPVFVEDPFERDASGKLLRANAPGLWRRHTDGVPNAALAVLKRLQPYARASQHGKAAEHHALAILHVLQNADKHSQLVVMPNGLWHCEVTVDGQPDHCVLPVVKDGTPLVVSEAKVQVEVDGILTVAVGRRADRTYELPRAFETIIDFVLDDVLSALKPFL